MKKYVLGVDGGGTKTHYALFDTDGKMVCFLQGGRANHEMYQEGYEGTRQELTGSLQRVFRESGLSIEDIGYGVFGLAGIDVPEQKKIMQKMIKEIGLTGFKVFNDAFLGIKAVNIHGYGICSINGTGACCAGIDPRGSWKLRNGADLSNVKRWARGESSCALFICLSS